MVSDTEWTDGSMHPEYQILSTSVVSNNTSRHNGAVYCNQGGVMLQTTMVNNVSVGTVDPADNESAQTGGLYVKGYSLSVNSVLWNNLIKVWGIERSGFFNDRGKWAKGFENQRV
jgi:hypothetical protein